MKLLTVLLVICLASHCLAQITFEPPAEPLSIQAVKTAEPINIDGRLDEASWRTASPITDFIQKDPTQGDTASMFTEAKILFDGENLYVGAVCKTTNGRADIRTQNMQRDFNYFQNDLFGIAIDGFLDRRNAMSFQTNPHG
ncbi:MAG: carbohydrate binding family 9 domain-containing protein, partial [Bacteroidota bacterium]